jgi:DnaA family protein
MSTQLLLEFIPTPDPTLDNTLVGENAGAIDAARGLQPGRALYLWGPPGSGRSSTTNAST